MKTRMRWGLMGVAGLLALGAGAVGPAELEGLLESSTSVTVVDIRDESWFLHGHIPNAINVPARVLPLKKLPPLGYVVVYGGGLGADKTAEAVRILNEKPGIKAEALEGGYAGWKTYKGNTTQAAGMHKEALNVITYQTLQELDAEDEVVLVDLRKAKPAPKAVSAGRSVASEPAPLTALNEKFPGRTVVKSPFEVNAVARRAGGDGQRTAMSSDPEPVPMMVLIDNGDGDAQKMARILKANGVHRVVILAGGEKILERDGASGLQRLGLGSQTVEGDDE